MNPEEGELRGQLSDRIGLKISVSGINNIEDRIEIMKQIDDFEKDPESFIAKYADAEDNLQKRIIMARKLLPSVSISDEYFEIIARLTRNLGVEGHRNDITILKTAKAIAAFNNHWKVTMDDLEESILLVLGEINECDNNQIQNQIQQAQNEMNQEENSEDSDNDENSSQNQDSSNEEDDSNEDIQDDTYNEYVQDNDLKDDNGSDNSFDNFNNNVDNDLDNLDNEDNLDENDEDESDEENDEKNNDLDNPSNDDYNNENQIQGEVNDSDRIDDEYQMDYNENKSEKE